MRAPSPNILKFQRKVRIIAYLLNLIHYLNDRVFIVISLVIPNASWARIFFIFLFVGSAIAANGDNSVQMRLR